MVTMMSHTSVKTLFSVQPVVRDGNSTENRISKFCSAKRGGFTRLIRHGVLSTPEGLSDATSLIVYRLRTVQTVIVRTQPEQIIGDSNARKAHTKSGILICFAHSDTTIKVRRRVVPGL